MKLIALTLMWLSLGVFYTTFTQSWPLGILCFAVALVIAFSIGRKKEGAR